MVSFLNCYLQQEKNEPTYTCRFLVAATGLIEAIPDAEISVVCTIESTTMQETVYNFMIEDAEGKEALKKRLVAAFHAAERLCAYNAVLFDIPFMQKQLLLPDAVVHEWLLKLCDPFHTMRTCFGLTSKLDKMLALNGLECKSATGLQAIEMAKNGEWESLVDYCMDDVRLTVQLCQQSTVRMFEHSDGFWVCCAYPRGGETIKIYCRPKALDQQGGVSIDIETVRPEARAHAAA